MSRRRNPVEASRVGVAGLMESRVLLSGSVSAQLADGVLTVHGDRSGNEIVVTDDGAGHIVVSEVDGGKVNGGNDIEFDSAEVKSIAISGKGGNDIITVATVAVDENISISGNAGDDEVIVADSLIGGKLSLQGNAGKDFLGIFASDVTGDTSVSGATGDDEVVLAFAAHGKVNVKTDGGKDIVTFDGSVLDKAVTVDTGAGADRVESFVSNFGGTLEVNAGAGKDTILAEGNNFDGNVNIKTKAGKDEITVNGNNFNGTVKLDGGAGKDTLNADALNVFSSKPKIKKIETKNI